jgi:hypothetical protein
MGKQSLANAHIAMLNELSEGVVTELTSTMVDETVLAILMLKGSDGVTIVTWQKKIIFDIWVNPT